MSDHYSVARGTVTIVTTTLFLFGISSFLGCSGEAEGGAGRGSTERLVPAVEAVESRMGSLPLTERLSGVVKAKNQVELYPQLSAAVVQVYVENGDLVQEDEPLVRLRDTEYREQLKQAEANLQITRAQAKQAEAEHKRLQAELKRSQSLANQNLISPTELETIETEAIAAEAEAELARARVEQAEATVEEHREELSRAIVRAPVEGRVGNRNAEIGMVVNANTRLFTIGKLDTVRVEIVLTDRMLSYIREDMRTEIMSPALSDGLASAPIARISPFLHPVTHSTTAEIELPNPNNDLKPGMFVSVDVFYGESEEATLVPLSALWENPTTGNVGIFVSQDQLTGEPIAMLDDPRPSGLTEPVMFEFFPVEVVAKGRMNAGVRGIDSGAWIVTIGQDLLGSDTGMARVRPVKWEWVEELQQLQREDLLEKIMKRETAGQPDTTLIGSVVRNPAVTL